MDNISETKTPQPGEWWLRNTGRGGRIFFICGFTPDGCPVCWNQDVGFFSSKMRFFCREFHHEPRCTGFGWVEPPAIDPGEGWELLPVGTVLERYDEFLTGTQWVMTGNYGKDTVKGNTYRRKIKPVESPAEDPNDMPLNPVPGKVVATVTKTPQPVESTDKMAAIIAEHTQQVRELTQRIGDLVQQVNERDAMIEKIRTALHQGYFFARC